MKNAKILVLRGGALGDFIVTLPALQALRERWPAGCGYIELTGYSHIAKLAEIAGLVDKVDSLDRAGIARLFSYRPTMTEEQVMRLHAFDIIINFLHDSDGCVAENLRLTGVPTILHGSPLVTAAHAADHFVRPLESLAIYAAGNAPRLRLPGALPRAKPPLAAIHPGSGSTKKNWPAENFVRLAEMLRGRGMNVVFLLGEADEAAEKIVREKAPDAEIWRHLPLPELAARLTAASLYIGNDSGISHLAAALGVPSVVLFGPSDPALWAPRGDHVTILRAPGADMAALAPDDIFARCV